MGFFSGLKSIGKGFKNSLSSLATGGQVGGRSLLGGLQNSLNQIGNIAQSVRGISDVIRGNRTSVFVQTAANNKANRRVVATKEPTRSAVVMPRATVAKKKFIDNAGERRAAALARRRADRAEARDAVSTRYLPGAPVQAGPAFGNFAAVAIIGILAIVLITR